MFIEFDEYTFFSADTKVYHSLTKLLLNSQFITWEDGRVISMEKTCSLLFTSLEANYSIFASFNNIIKQEFSLSWLQWTIKDLSFECNIHKKRNSETTKVVWMKKPVNEDLTFRTSTQREYFNQSALLSHKFKSFLPDWELR